MSEDNKPIWHACSKNKLFFSEMKIKKVAPRLWQANFNTAKNISTEPIQSFENEVKADDFSKLKKKLEEYLEVEQILPTQYQLV